LRFKDTVLKSLLNEKEPVETPLPGEAVRGQAAELNVKLAAARKELDKARAEVKSLRDAAGASSDRMRAKLAAELAAVDGKWKAAAAGLKVPVLPTVP
jgi:peptidoglycan hydrolase CwlO-like protein